jgi:hypothetical protein
MRPFWKGWMAKLAGAHEGVGIGDGGVGYFDNVVLAWLARGGRA